MSAILFRILIFLVIGIAIWLGVRRIWRDWRGHFKSVDKLRHQRDLEERARPDVIDLKRDKDGKFRPGADDDRP
jgi:hypothetical protein